jgi:aspartyl-tRNA(Asn)/glutamyl-tRNA(Gln) amidotransferase subunit B
MEKAVADFFEDVVDHGADPKAAANWILSSLFSIFNKEGIDRESIGQTNVSAQNLAELVRMVSDNTLNKGSAEKVLEIMWQTGDDPAAIVEREGLAQVSDERLIAEKVAEVLAQNETMVQRYLGGQEKVFGALIGKCMAALRGKGNPQIVTRVLRDKLDAMKS